jgi:hypothetical protein
MIVIIICTQTLLTVKPFQQISSGQSPLEVEVTCFAQSAQANDVIVPTICIGYNQFTVVSSVRLHYRENKTQSK